MHEASLLLEALDIAAEHVRRAGASRILRMTLRVGPLSGVEPDALAFAFDALTPGTFADGARLEFAPAPVSAECRACGAAFEPADVAYECPACGEPSAAILSGRELELASLEVE